MDCVHPGVQGTRDNRSYHADYVAPTVRRMVLSPGDQPTAVYECWLKLQDASPALDGSKPQLQIDFQFSPRAHARVKAGKNEFELFLRSPDDMSLANWKGVDLEITWEEVIRQ